MLRAGARVLILFLPGGLERTFVATGDAEHEAAPDEQEIEVVGPPLTM